MCLPYDNVENAAQHLSGTVVMYDDRPYYVRDVFGGRGTEIQAHLLPLPRMQDEIIISIFDPLFDAKVVGSRLGYVNIGENWGAIWTSRIPSRQYKQGLVRQNVSIPRNPVLGAYRFDNLINHGAFVDTMRGVYPTYDECLKKMKDNPRIPSVAFHRHFALERQELGFYLLAYRNERVAWGDPKSFKVPSEFSYLSEMLTQLGVPYES